jgi:hypothetical protein
VKRERDNEAGATKQNGSPNTSLSTNQRRRLFSSGLGIFSRTQNPNAMHQLALPRPRSPEANSHRLMTCSTACAASQTRQQQLLRVPQNLRSWTGERPPCLRHDMADSYHRSPALNNGGRAVRRSTAHLLHLRLCMLCFDTLSIFAAEHELRLLQFAICSTIPRHFWVVRSSLKHGHLRD